MGRMSPVCLSPIQLFGVRSGYQNQASNRIQNHIVLLNTLSVIISFDIYSSTRAPVVGFTLRLLSIFTVVCEPRHYFANYPRQISVCCSSRLDFPRLNELLLLSWPLLVLPRLLASVRTWSGPEVKLLRSRQLLTNILQVLSTLACPKKFN